MSCLGNILWLILGGFFPALGWLFCGLLLSITIVGIPLGKQCFKMARLQLLPFGKKVEYSENSIRVSRILGNLIWIVLFGWVEFSLNIAAMILFAVTIIGIPFAIQSWKLAKLALWPFGAKIEN